ncbi:STT3 domain-containing protein [Chloroflexota bacterium]
MSKFRISSKLVVFVMLAVLAGVGFFLRVYFPYEEVFTREWIKFTSIDAYYHMRLVDSIVHNFPHIIRADYYLLAPGTFSIGTNTFFDWLLAAIIWIVSFGSPTQHIIDVAGVYYPVILAVLTVIPIFFIGKVLFGRWVGVIAAGLLMVMPGEYMGRTILGFTDYHVAEALLTTTTVMFLLYALKAAKEQNLTYEHLVQRNWEIIRKPLIYSFLTGIFLWLYLWTWAGALLFVFIISAYLLIQFVIDHVKGEATDYLAVTGAVLFLVALILFWNLVPRDFYRVSLVVAFILPLLAGAVSHLMLRRKLKRYYYPLALVGSGLLALLVLFLVAPSLVKTMVSQFSILVPMGGRTTLEMGPLLSPRGEFTTVVGWGNFTTSLFLIPSDWNPDKLWWFPGFALIPGGIAVWLWIKQGSDKKHRTLLLVLFGVMLVTALVLWFVTPQEWKMSFPGFALIALAYLVWLIIKQRSDDKPYILFLIWTLVILMATLAQRRFAYYFAVNVALLTGYLSWLLIWSAGLRKLVEKFNAARAAPVPGAKAKRVKKGGEGITVYHVNTVLAIIVIFTFVYAPNIWYKGASLDVAKQAAFAPTDAWYEALDWMRDNTPEPFGDSDFYYEYYDPKNYQYPESAYGVMTWWDYGYWVSRIGHRAPNANPSQPPKPIIDTAQFFLSQDEASGEELIEKLDSKYIIIDHMTTGSKIWAVMDWSGEDVSRFYETFYVPQGEQLIPVNLFYPEYYQSLVVRMFNFNCEAVSAAMPIVITYEEVIVEGQKIKQVTDGSQFDSYQEALDYMQEQDPDRVKLVGGNPFVSSVPLDALHDYQLVYSSESGIMNTETGFVPGVKVFEYTGHKVE